METLVQTTTLSLKKDVCLSEDDLNHLGIYPTNNYCFSYQHYVLYQKGNLRIILKPLPHNLYKVIRTYEFIPA